MLFRDEKKSHQVVEKEMPRTDLQELCLRRCVGEVPRRWKPTDYKRDQLLRSNQELKGKNEVQLLLGSKRDRYGG
jgi:hypothetical protein